MVVKNWGMGACWAQERKCRKCTQSGRPLLGPTIILTMVIVCQASRSREHEKQNVGVTFAEEKVPYAVNGLLRKMKEWSIRHCLVVVIKGFE